MPPAAGDRCARIVRRLVRWSCCALLFALASPPLLALDPERSIRQFHQTRWTAREGAPSQVSALAQTSDGYLWIGSARGLYRFDGVRFELYTPPEGTRLPSDNVYALAATPDGGLWVSFRPHGLAFLGPRGHLRVWGRKELPEQPLYALARDLDGTMWAATHEGLVAFSHAHWALVGEERGLPPGRIWCLLVGRDGKLWVATGNSIFVLRRGEDRFESTGATVIDPLRMAEDAAGRLWVGDGLRTLWLVADDGRPSASIPFATADLLVDRDGALWAAGLDGVLRLASTREWPVSGDHASVDRDAGAERLTDTAASNVLEDREGTIWVGTAKGLDRFRHGDVVPVALPPSHQKLTLLAGEGGEVWAASAVVASLARVDGDTVELLALPGQTSSATQAADGTVWWGGFGGLWRQRGRAIEHFPTRVQPSWEWIWEVLPAPGGDGLWLGLGDAGLFRFSAGTWSPQPPLPGLVPRVPSASFRDALGRTWLGYTEDRVCLVGDDGRVRAFTRRDGLDVGRIRVIRGRREPWLGGELGLAMFHGGRFHAVRSAGGERFRTVSGIIETADGSLWLNELRGVVRIAAGEVARLRDDPGHPVTYRLFDFLDGMPGAPQMNFTVSTAVEASDGRLWFATDDGLARIDPARLSHNPLPPPVSIQELESDHQRYPGHTPLTLPVGTRSVAIRYAALSLSMPERVHFRYRLEGFDAEWQEVGTRREAFYTNLRPGRYTFRVAASNHDGVWNETGATLALVLPPAFYQTRWFLAACLLSAAGLAAALYRLRLGQVAARLERLHGERLDERQRIAQDLHDTLLQGFLSASMQLHVAATQLPDPSPARALVDRVLELMAKVSDEGRRTLQGLRAPTSEAPALEEALARLRPELDGRGTVGFQVVALGRPRRLHDVVRDEAYRIGREALVNAFRHAKPGSVEVEVEYDRRHLRLRVRDDGRGIDPQVIAAGRDGHFGLSGMRERAERIGGRLGVTSRAGAGTEVELLVPAALAFRRQSERRRGGRRRWLGGAPRGG